MHATPERLTSSMYGLYAVTNESGSVYDVRITESGCKVRRQPGSDLSVAPLYRDHQFIAVTLVRVEIGSPAIYVFRKDPAPMHQALDAGRFLYAGTTRTTSRVVSIVRIAEPSEASGDETGE